MFSHIKFFRHSANFDDFTILSPLPEFDERMIHESLLVARLKVTFKVALFLLKRFCAFS